MRTRPLVAVIACALALAAPAAADRGSAGLGDPFFPRAGNGGYDVGRYAAKLAYRPRSGVLRGSVRIRARALRPLDRFNLDFRRLRVLGVTVNGRAAGFRHRGGELAITPRASLRQGKTFTAVVAYRGRPGTRRDPDGGSEGWFRTSDGAFVAGEPLGTALWLPCNNYLRDKAAFSFEITVPAGLKAVANGRLRRVQRRGARKTWSWRASDPMLPYLATVNIGRGELTKSRAGGVPSWVMVDPREARRSRAALSRLGDVMRFLSRLYGPYPFSSTGAIVDRARRVEYALETQTRPVYDRAPDETLIVHETAHQWFGNSVSLPRWPAIWLNEGFATFSEWIWLERHGGPSARRIFRAYMAQPASRKVLWTPPPGRVRRPAQLFAGSVYIRGAMTLQALRMKIGDRAFFTTMRRWAQGNRYGNGSTRRFIALAERRSGRQLDGLFRRWLYKQGKPARGGAARPLRDVPAVSLRPRRR